MVRGKGPYICGLDAAVDVVGGKWKPLILWALDDAEGPLRFGELRRQVPGVSEKVLIQQLRELEADGVVRREVFPEVPPRVEYSLTDVGDLLNTALGPLGEWGGRHMDMIVARKHPEYRKPATAEPAPSAPPTAPTPPSAPASAASRSAQAPRIVAETSDAALGVDHPRRVVRVPRAPGGRTPGAGRPTPTPRATGGV